MRLLTFMIIKFALKKDTHLQKLFFTIWKEIYISEKADREADNTTASLVSRDPCLFLTSITKLKAVAHREWFLLNKYFYSGWMKFLQESKLEKKKRISGPAAKDVVKNRPQIPNMNAKTNIAMRNADLKSKSPMSNQKGMPSNKSAEVTPKKAANTKHVLKETSAVKTKRTESVASLSKSPLENRQIVGNLSKPVEKQVPTDELLYTNPLQITTPITPVVEFSTKNQLDQSFGIDTNQNASNVETGILNPFSLSPTEDNFTILNNENDDLEEEQIDQIETRIRNYERYIFPFN